MDGVTEIDDKLSTKNVNQFTLETTIPWRFVMAKTLEISIRCLHCQQWFPSPIFFGDSESFSTATLFGNLAQCRHCGKMTECNKENFRAKFDDGGFLGNDTV